DHDAAIVQRPPASAVELVKAVVPGPGLSVLGRRRGLHTLHRRCVCARLLRVGNGTRTGSDAGNKGTECERKPVQRGDEAHRDVSGNQGQATCPTFTNAMDSGRRAHRRLKAELRIPVAAWSVANL